MQLVSILCEVLMLKIPVSTPVPSASQGRLLHSQHTWVRATSTAMSDRLLLFSQQAMHLCDVRRSTNPCLDMLQVITELLSPTQYAMCEGGPHCLKHRHPVLCSMPEALEPVYVEMLVPVRRGHATGLQEIARTPNDVLVPVQWSPSPRWRTRRSSCGCWPLPWRNRAAVMKVCHCPVHPSCRLVYSLVSSFNTRLCFSLQMSTCLMC